MFVLAALAYAFVAIVLFVGVCGVGAFIRGFAEDMRGAKCRHCGRSTWVDEAGWNRHVWSGERRCAGAETTATPIVPQQSVPPTDSAALSRTPRTFCTTRELRSPMRRRPLTWSARITSSSATRWRSRTRLS